MKKHWKKFVLIGVIVIFLGFCFWAWLVYSNLSKAADLLSKDGDLIFKNFSAAFNRIQELKPGEARRYLNQNSEKFFALDDILSKAHSSWFVKIVGGIIPLLREASGLFNQIGKTNENFLDLTDLFEDLLQNGFKYLSYDGDALINIFDSSRNDLKGIVVQTESLRNYVGNLKSIFPSLAGLNKAINDNYLTYSSDLRSTESLFDGILKLLNEENERHILLVFQNPAEMRPSGGFIGSFADLILYKGQILDVDVRDIADIDETVSLKLIPPEPLRTIAEEWRVQDSNWFFDFPTSARALIQFFENSEIYNGVGFDAVVALNTNVLKDILGVVGPIQILDSGLEISKDNFYEQIQKTVESLNDSEDVINRKEILSILAPLILEKINELGSVEEFVVALKNSFSCKDIMVWSKDSQIENFSAHNNLDGAVYELPNDFWGSYLAVVNANIGGEKSDAFIEQTVEAKINLDSEGNAFTDLTVRRKHNGNVKKESWWRATNKDFIQIFTAPGSSISAIKGNFIQASTTQVDYQAGGYGVNPDLDAIEKEKVFLTSYKIWQMPMAGKRVFGTWFNVAAGKTGVLNLKYETPKRGAFVLNAGETYGFVFENQAGAKNKLEISIGAPLGFIWQESNASFFNYETDDPEGRILLNLTLLKAAEQQ